MFNYLRQRFSVACAGFILAGAEQIFRKKFSAPGAEQTRGGGQKTLLYLEKEGETFNDRSLSNPQLTVQFFL